MHVWHDMITCLNERKCTNYCMWYIKCVYKFINFVSNRKLIVMVHGYCSCGPLLYRSSSVRVLKSPCLRLFMPIRTMKIVTSETKNCNSCRTADHNWKSRYPEFGIICTRLEEELVECDICKFK